MNNNPSTTAAVETEETLKNAAYKIATWETKNEKSPLCGHMSFNFKDANLWKLATEHKWLVEHQNTELLGEWTEFAFKIQAIVDKINAIRQKNGKEALRLDAGTEYTKK